LLGLGRRGRELGLVLGAGCSVPGSGAGSWSLDAGCQAPALRVGCWAGAGAWRLALAGWMLGWVPGPGVEGWVLALGLEPGFT
jgi:hypothetical protein